MFRTVKRSPGCVWVIVMGATRASEQVMKSASGNCPCSASRRYSSLFALQYSFWKWWIPAISFCMARSLPAAFSLDDTRYSSSLSAIFPVLTCINAG